MIKDNQRHFNRLHVFIDAFLVIVSYLLAWVIRFPILKGDPGLPFVDYCWLLVPLVPYTLFVYFDRVLLQKQIPKLPFLWGHFTTEVACNI